MPPIKVAIDSQIFCSQQYGGVSRYFARLAAELLGQQQQVRVFAPLHCNHYLSELPADCVSGRMLPYCPPRSKRFLRPLNGLLSRGPIRDWGPDLVHESYYATRGSAPSKTPVVVTVLDMIHEVHGESFSALDNTSRTKRAAVERADHVICISENTRRDLLSLWGIAAEKTSVVYLGMDDFSPAFSSQPYVTSRGKPFLLYVANRSGYKNFTGLLQAYAMSGRIKNDFDLVVFGGGPFSRSEREVITGLGIDDASLIQLSGSDDLLASVYAGASAFVYPSFYEGFGLSPLEAMGQGCPVISSNASCLPEVLGSAAEYFEPTSTEMLRATMEAVLYDQDRLDALRSLGYERIRRFTWDSCARATLSVYQSVLGRTE